MAIAGWESASAIGGVVGDALYGAAHGGGPGGGAGGGTPSAAAFGAARGGEAIEACVLPAVSHELAAHELSPHGLESPPLLSWEYFGISNDRALYPFGKGSARSC